MGLFGIVWKVIALAVLAIIGLGAYLYFTDYEVSATVVDRSDSRNDPWVTIQPDMSALSSYRYKADLSSEAWQVVCVGYNVKFHVKSQDYKVYDRDGTLIYDSASGNLDLQRAAACAGSNAGNGGVFPAQVR